MSKSFIRVLHSSVVITVVTSCAVIHFLISFSSFQTVFPWPLYGTYLLWFSSYSDSNNTFSKVGLPKIKTKA